MPLYQYLKNDEFVWGFNMAVDLLSYEVAKDIRHQHKLLQVSLCRGFQYTRSYRILFKEYRDPHVRDINISTWRVSMY